MKDRSGPGGPLGLSVDGVDIRPEGLHARQGPGGSLPSVVKRKAGRKRRGRSLGRYPFLTWSNRYLSAVGESYAESTLKERERRLRRMSDDLIMLKRQRKIDSANPEKMTAEDVLGYVKFLRSKGLKEKSISHNISALSKVLTFVGNSAVEIFKMRYPSMNCRNSTARHPPLDEASFEKIIRAGSIVKDDDWPRIRAFALVTMALCSGLRTKELRFCDVTNLDTERWVIHVERVKGEETYGDPRTVAIRPEGYGILERYLKLRDKIVSEQCPGNLALFSALRGEDWYCSGNTIRKMKNVVEEEVGFKFTLQACRRTFGQMAVDEGLALDSVSVMLGHNTTKTTETYYCRKRQETAIREAQEVWNHARSVPSARNPKIEIGNSITGYA